MLDSGGRKKNTGDESRRQGGVKGCKERSDDERSDAERSDDERSDDEWSDAERSDDERSGKEQGLHDLLYDLL